LIKSIVVPWFGSLSQVIMLLSSGQAWARASICKLYTSGAHIKRWSSSSTEGGKPWPLFVQAGQVLHPAIPKHTMAPVHRNKTQTENQSLDKISDDTITHLERTSLVAFSTSESVQRLEEAIAFVQPLKEVNVEGVEPLYTTLEDQPLR
jgi:hypothetical protein